MHLIDQLLHVAVAAACLQELDSVAGSVTSVFLRFKPATAVLLFEEAGVATRRILVSLS